jgi:3-phosphoshikimate 1-carboxyvinyltransferase
MLALTKIEQLPERILLPKSKSLAARWLILQALFPDLISIENFQDSDDTLVLKEALSSIGNCELDVKHSGTALRFCLSYFAVQADRTVILKGSDRLHERPISIVVEALRKLGAEITYLEKEGCAPVQIKGKKLQGGSIQIDGGVSSQFVSSLMLVAPRLPGGLEIDLKGTIVSRSYIWLTLDVLIAAGIEATMNGNKIVVKEKAKLPEPKEVQLESDWSAAAYWYAWVALNGGGVNLLGLQSNSSQGDRKLIPFFEGLGVRTKEINGGLRIYKVDMALPEHLEMNLINQPDLAQPIAVVCALLGVEVKLNRLQTLTIKETNRLEALKEELSNFGISADLTVESIFIAPQKASAPKRPIKTYNDHRMAMSFSLFASQFDIEMEESHVVSKSYPEYFNQLLAQ